LAVSSFRLVLNGGGRFFSSVRKNLGVLVVLLFLSTVVVVFLAGRTLNVEKQFELNKLVYRFSTLGAEQGGFRRAFSKRTNLWADAGDLIEEFAYYELFFGGGFEYLKILGRKYSTDADAEGDPHNFIVAAMLYSGFIGCAAMIALISLTLFQLFRKREKYGTEFLLLYVTALVFTITGAASLFSVRLVPVIILTTFSVHD
jgi:O-antigen ligase